jgi:hypothetical protein
MREGWVAHGERCEANSARVVAARREAPTAAGWAGVKGSFAQRRAEFAAHGSPLQRCEGEA